MQLKMVVFPVFVNPMIPQFKAIYFKLLQCAGFKKLSVKQGVFPGAKIRQIQA
jgi:hypothetical protein